jgi:hypothetical protein
MNEIKAVNRKSNLGANYENDLTKEQIRKNIYAQGYEDGTDNFFNAVCAKFKIKR